MEPLVNIKGATSYPTTYLENKSPRKEIQSQIIILAEYRPRENCLFLVRFLGFSLSHKKKSVSTLHKSHLFFTGVDDMKYILFHDFAGRTPPCHQVSHRVHMDSTVSYNGEISHIFHVLIRGVFFK